MATLPNNIAIACGSGGYRTVFIHGVLTAFENAQIRATAYGGTSASVLATASAAIGKADLVGVDYWIYALEIKQQSTIGMSEVTQTTVADKAPMITAELFNDDAPRFVVPACAVVTEDGAQQTQSEQARRLGRKLLLSAARRKPSDWVTEHLELHLFDTKGGDHPLTLANFSDVGYASSRMMHAWDIPATINGNPYVDGSYLCSIPVIELAQSGDYDAVIAISADAPSDTLYADIFGVRAVPDTLNDTPIYKIMPEVDPASLGADFTDATPDGLKAAYQQGIQQGQAFIGKWS